MQFGPASALYNEGEGALNNVTAKTLLKAKGAAEDACAWATRYDYRRQTWHTTTPTSRRGG
eukprot:388996-Pyramimonas_sp.AAC.1